uniref:nanos homolog 3 n=1 Tax=Podarcis muralis TaxID=64176 RepID=UPI00109FB89E|nr:nanos homolog 3 [Podarcis muralis]
MAAFQLWRDYFQLARVVQEMRWRSARSSWPGAFADQAPPPPPRKEAPPAGVSRPARHCAFCKHNGESRAIYASHALKDSAGRVQCPILRNYTCPQCGASQDRAHTRKFCPLTNKGYTSVYSCVRNSAGKKASNFKTKPAFPKT